MSLVFNDKTFQQADEGTVNVLKYTFGNGVNLVSVQQESLPDYYCLLFIFSLNIKPRRPSLSFCLAFGLAIDQSEKALIPETWFAYVPCLDCVTRFFPSLRKHLTNTKNEWKRNRNRRKQYLILRVYPPRVAKLEKPNHIEWEWGSLLLWVSNVV